VIEASYEYEICLKCHGISDQTTTTGLIRQDSIRNIRLAINPSNPSYHPVANVGRNSMMQGFEPTSGLTAASLIYCSDCHSNDDWTRGGSQPHGPHSSRFSPLLERDYQTNDPSADTYQNYALCYKCHNRDFLVNDQARTFPHNKHVSKDQESCAVCHDAHGSRQNAHLINFMLLDRTRKTVVSPSQTQKRLQYITLGPGRGQCFLMCHGKNHEPLSYP
jgi:hypothetical protein